LTAPWDWTEVDLLSLITNNVKESIELDYKQCLALEKNESKKNELSKDVSAFANSAGGTILYGMHENGHVPTRIDVGYDPAVISKEWIEQVIGSRIQRKIDGVRINQIDLNQSSPGKVAYSVWIPQSLRAPHQASDKRFYKRYNFQSVAMEEYEIRDVGRRSEAPDLKVLFHSPLGSDVPLAFGENEAFSNAVELLPLVTNCSAVPAEYAIIDLYVDSRLRITRGPAGLASGKQLTANAGWTTFDAKHFARNWGIPGSMPIFESAQLQLGEGAFFFGFPKSADDFLIGWECRAPRMTPKQGTYILRSNGMSVAFRERVASS
jgi:hypothetical protein